MKGSMLWITVSRKVQSGIMVLVLTGIGVYGSKAAAQGQPETQPAAPAVQAAQQGPASGKQPVALDRVTINVTGGSIADVLSAFSRQTL